MIRLDMPLRLSGSWTIAQDGVFGQELRGGLAVSFSSPEVTIIPDPRSIVREDRLQGEKDEAHAGPGPGR